MPTSKPRERWADEACFEVNRERMHVPLRAYESRAAVLGRRLCDELPAGPWLLALTPARWSFSLASKPADAPSVSGPGGFDAAGWGDLQVPCSWEVAGVGSKPVYLNERYPFKLDPPRVPTDERNEVGSYQVSFTLPARWIGRRSYLVLDGLGSAATVWIDGAEVGYSQDSRLPAEFEVTKLVSAEGMSASEHVLSVQVVRYSDGSYLEDQDQWWLSGIQRHCFLYSKPARLAIRDFAVSTTVPPSGATADFSLDVALAGSIVDAAATDTAAAAKAFSESGLAVRASLHGPFRLGRQQDLEAPLPACSEAWAATLAPPTLAEDVDVARLSAVGRPAPGADDADPHHALLDDDAHGLMSLRGCPARARGGATLEAPALWSAEEPNLYSLVVELVAPGSGGEDVLDVETCLVGLRSVSIEGGLLRVNGAPLTIKGVNRHEHTAEGGKAVSWESMLLDATMLKAYNFNAVRTAHYPNTDAWYEICAAVGLYVVDEANLETHGFSSWGDEGYLSKQPSWRHAYLSRMTRMVRRDKNSPCVIVWSLGNESGYGPNHDAMAAWCRTHDPSRPVQYESCGGGDATDIICPMYPDKKHVEKVGSSAAGQNAKWMFAPTRRFPLGTREQPRPLIPCEFAHAMGNSTGNYADWWELFASLPYAQGGFIWDWADQGLHQTDPKTGKHFWAYGGDFECKQHDAQFCINGLVFPDRTPHPALHEVKHVHRPVDVALLSAEPAAEPAAGKRRSAFRVRISSRYDHLPSLAHLSLRCGLEVGGVEVGEAAPLESGGGGWRAVGARDSCEVDLEVVWDPALAPYRPSEVYLALCFTLSEESAWAAAGHEVAAVQLHIDAAALGEQLASQAPPARAAAALESPAAAPLKCSDLADAIEVSGSGAEGAFSVVVCKTTGTLRSLAINGESLLAAGSAALNLWRAPTDNDNGATPGMPAVTSDRKEWLAQFVSSASWSKPKPQLGWATLQPLYLRPFYSTVGPFLRWLGVGAVQSWAYIWKHHSLDSLSREAVAVQLVEAAAERVVIRCKCDLRTPKGRTRAKHELLVTVSADGSVALDTTAKAPDLLGSVRWLGQGPHENYPDRAAGARFGMHSATSAELFTPYVVPSECGHRGGTTWLVLSAPGGRGLAVSSEEPFGWSALPHGAQAIDAAAHPSDLEPEAHATLCVDHRMMGVGGDIGWGRSVWPEYLVPDGAYTWRTTLRPFKQPPATPPAAAAPIAGAE